VSKELPVNEVVGEDFSLGIAGFTFADLYQPARLRDLHTRFWNDANEVNPPLSARFAMLADESLPNPERSEILIEVAAVVGDFLARLFDIRGEVDSLAADTLAYEKIFQFKQDFLKARVFKHFGKTTVDDALFQLLDAEVEILLKNVPPQTAYSQQQTDPEIRFADCVLTLLHCDKDLTEGKDGALHPAAASICSHRPEPTLAEKVQHALTALADWCVQVNATPARRERVAGWVSFIRPATLDYEHLVQIDRPNGELPETIMGPEHHRRQRDGFKLTDPRMNRKEYLREIDYCIICHPREKDSCSHGFRDKTGARTRNPLGIELAGCPLEEKISEMHLLRKRGQAIAALAMIMLDNPMCPGTGHRICNDCMKGCIFQKQEPVNIPQAETGVVSDVLNLPLGFEIYSLLTRFNPLNRERPHALPYNGVDVLVVGLGPAGYTLAHYLANEGFGVVGIDGLKLEPIPDSLTGSGQPVAAPIRDFNVLKQQLDVRILAGFGGVSEYGITVRWDKTFLAVMYLTLLRRRNVRFFGGVRFGGTLTIDDAWELGFKHVALATGAGKPTIIPMKHNILRGIRTASDFLMALQLTGAFKKSTLANLQVRLPGIVIGGGLTAIDTATEMLAYYPVQVEKTLDQFKRLSAEFGEPSVWGMCDPEEKEILQTFLDHGRAIRSERESAARQQRAPNFAALCDSWGGVSIAYRKRMIDSPAYRLNHEEVTKALEEGIRFVENVIPLEAIADNFGAVSSLKFKRLNGQEVTLPARAVCYAAGTTPNTVCEREAPGTFQLDADERFFQRHKLVADGDGWQLEAVNGPSREAFFMSYNQDGRFVSFYGDNHPDFAGNVVKAMASSKHGVRQVNRLFAKEIAQAEAAGQPLAAFEKLTQSLDESLVPRVVEVKRLNAKIIEVIVKAPYAARRFQPGQFFRLQNYESRAPVVDGVRLTLEGIALTGAWVDLKNDLLSMIVLEMGVSSRLCAVLKPGEPVVVMGPTGTASETPEGETVLLAGGGLGNAVLFSIGKALRDRGSRVIYFAGYRSHADIFFQEALEEATDQVIWSVDSGDPIVPRRKSDLSFVGNIVQSMLAYAKGELAGKPLISLHDVDRIIAIGSDRMMAAVSEARHSVLKPFLKTDHVGIASINSMMQCMMKEVCGQCLQQHVNPETKAPTEVVFSCFNQDQHMDNVDFGNLRQRLETNSLAEKLSNRYLDILIAPKKAAT
jgi:NADPH-dependent glutamate synthase beta subunit-like oxidoreductase/NAD(P)H-flavin reductase